MLPPSPLFSGCADSIHSDANRNATQVLSGPNANQLTGPAGKGHARGGDPEFERWQRNVLEGLPPKRFQVAAAGGSLNSLEMSPREILVLGGHPASGKTALAQQLMFDALSQPGQSELRALVCNVEMPLGALLDRELSRMSGVPYSLIRKREVASELMERIHPCLESLSTLYQRITFLQPPFSASRLVSEAWELGPDIVVVDYIQRLRAHGNESRIQVSAVMESLREIASGGSAVIAVAALNRSSHDTGGQAASNFRDSSEIEYGADSAYILDRKLGLPNATLKCVKRRYGTPEDLKLTFDGDRQLFTPREQESVR